MSLIDRIAKLKENVYLSKHEQLVQGVIEAIDDGLLQVGDKLPSINTMVNELGFARKTIVRAYEELKARGLIESKKLKGYYVISRKTNVTLKIALVMYSFQSLQEEFYNTFRNELGKRFQMDVFFHHNNIPIFETIISNIKGKYGKYVIAPIQDESIPYLLRDIPKGKLLLIDRYLFLGPEYAFVSQEFENATYDNLVKLVPDIQKYEKMILFFNGKNDYSPIGIKNAFNRFLSAYNINGAVEKEYKRGTLKKNTLYFIKNDSMLWRFLKDCVENKIAPGEDLGILSFDDNVSKQIVLGGITTMSTDFNHMAQLAADHIKFGNKIQTILPLHLFRRKSL